MPSIRAVATANPPYELHQRDVKAFADGLFRDSDLDIDKLISVFDRARIKRRFLSQPLDWYSHDHEIWERSRLHREISLAMGVEAAQKCLSKCAMSIDDISMIIVVSTTGLITPTLDAPLLKALGMSPTTKRLPIWGLGCAGGASGLARAMDFCRAKPDANILLLTIETCSLTFQRGDMGKSNLVATAIFSDGAAAAVISGDAAGRGSISLIDSFTTTWPDTEDIMGWEFNDQGMMVVFSPAIPATALRYLDENFNAAHASARRSRDSMRYLIAHPGGVKVLTAYEQALSLPREMLQDSYDILEQYGNMSSATILFVLERFLDRRPSAGEQGVFSAFGPGFSSELVFFDTQEPA